MEMHEGFFKGDGGVRLFIQSWTPQRQEPKGTLTITHGQGEHSDCYRRLVKAVEPLQWKIIAWDLRGHGRSEGERGNAPSFDSYVRDYECFLNLVESRLIPQKRLVHLAHSMGGLIHLKHILNEPELRKRIHVLSAPFLGLNLPDRLVRNALVSSLVRTIPRLSFGDALAGELCSRDPAIRTEYARDPLRHSKLAGHLVLEALEAAEMVQARAELLNGPLLLQIPEKDPIVNSDESRRFFKSAGSTKKVLKEYYGRRHEIYNDLGREEVFKDLIEFLQKPTDSKKKGQPLS